MLQGGAINFVRLLRKSCALSNRIQNRLDTYRSDHCERNGKLVCIVIPNAGVFSVNNEDQVNRS